MGDVAILIPSCDSFSDCHPVTLECIRRFWPDCPWPLYTLSESGWGDNPIAVGEDRGWAGNLVYGLDQIEEEFVLMFLEDMLISQPVDTAQVKMAARFVQIGESVAFRVGPGPETYRQHLQLSYIAKILTSSQYRISTSPTIWNKNYLRWIASNPAINTAWQFELEGTRIAQQMEGDILKLTCDPLPMQLCYTAITKGEFEEGALIWLRNIGIEVETDRPVKGWQKGQRWPTAK